MSLYIIRYQFAEVKHIAPQYHARDKSLCTFVVDRGIWMSYTHLGQGV